MKTGPAFRELAVCIGGYAAGVLLARWVAGFFVAEHPAWSDACLWVGLAALVGVQVLQRRFPDAAITQWVWVVAGLLALTNIFVGAISVHQYGDAKWLTKALARGPDHMHRWLGGYAILEWLYDRAIAIDVLAELAGSRRTLAAYFVKVLSVIVMVGGTVLLHRRWPGRLSLHLATLTPIWILFAAGYIEYYPFLVVPMLALLQWTLDRPLEERQAWVIGVLAALLFPFAYIGFAPLAVFLLLAFSFARPKRAVIAWVVALGLAALAAHLLLPGGIDGYLAGFRRLPRGDGFLAFRPYRGQAAGPDSIFFSWEYALSLPHLRHMAIMWTFGAGVMVLPLSLAGISAGLRGHARSLRRLLPQPRTWFAVAVVGWFAYYLLRMIPRLGPVKDIDLFAPVYVTGAFFAGWLLDRSGLLTSERTRVARLGLLAVFVGASVFIAAHLVVHGLPGAAGRFSSGWLH